MDKGSPKTSRNQLSAGFKKIDWEKIKTNFDVGGGKYDKGSKYLKEKGVKNVIYDLYNRSDCHNALAWKLGDDTEISTLFNVLNVVPTKEERIHLLKKAERKNTQKIYITVYEKNKSGIGERTRDGWQTNMKLKDYLPEVQEVYPEAYIKNKMIIINTKEIL